MDIHMMAVNHYNTRIHDIKSSSHIVSDYRCLWTFMWMYSATVVYTLEIPIDFD